MAGDGKVGFAVLFGQNFDGREMRCKARAAKLVGLLVVVAFGYEDEAVPGSKICERRVHGWQKLDLMLGNGLGKAEDALVLIWCDRRIGELLETVDERPPEAVEAIAVGRDGGVLAVIEMLAYLFRRVNTMIEVGDEGRDSALEVDIVFP